MSRSSEKHWTREQLLSVQHTVSIRNELSREWRPGHPFWLPDGRKSTPPASSELGFEREVQLCLVSVGIRFCICLLVSGDRKSSFQPLRRPCGRRSALCESNDWADQLTDDRWLCYGIPCGILPLAILGRLLSHKWGALRIERTTESEPRSF